MFIASSRLIQLMVIIKHVDIMVRLLNRTERENKSVSLKVIRSKGVQHFEIICRKGLLYEKIEYQHDSDLAYKLYQERLVSYLGLPNIL